MPDFIEELATKDSLMKVALILKTMQLMTPLEYDEVSKIPPHESYKKATQLVHTLYKMIERDRVNSYGVKSILIRVAHMHGLVQRWDDAGKHSNFLAEPLFMSCALFVNLEREKKRAMKHQKQVRFSPRAPASGVAGRRMLANVSQISSEEIHNVYVYVKGILIAIALRDSI